MLRLVCIVMLCCFAKFSWAADAAAQLQQRLQPIHSLAADFKQIVYSSEHKVLQHSAGQMKLLRPGQLYWQTQQPAKQLVLVKRDKTWIYDPDLAQVTIMAAAHDQQSLPALLLSDEPQQLLQQFEVKQLSAQHFALAAHDPQNTCMGIELGFNAQGLQQIKCLDQLQQLTVINLSDVKENGVINKQVFDFVAPEGVDVIDNTVVQ